MVWVIVFAFAAIAAFKFEFRRRGKRFVRAFLFLEALDCGEDIESANNLAKMAFRHSHLIDLDRSAIERATVTKDRFFGGRQLPVISLAIEKGFTE